MKIIRRNRGKGKTTELIKLSSEKWYYIVCSTKRRAEHIVNMADKMGLDIPFPLTLKELPTHSPYIRGLLIDDFEEVLQHLVGGVPIVQCTTSCEVDMQEDNKNVLNSLFD